MLFESVALWNVALFLSLLKTLVKNCNVEKTSINAEGVSMEGYYPYAGGLVGEVLTNSVSIRNSSICPVFIHLRIRFWKKPM